MQSLYFAYGSNLSTPRLLGRVASAVVVAPARLFGRRLTTDKRGRDGSGKANLADDPQGHVWGVVYAIRAEQWAALDACESGYARLRVEVHTARDCLEAWTYASDRFADEPVPFSWYKRLIVDGAREHGLPAAWLRLLEALPEKPDPARR